jgi:hypothetical protein
MMQKRFITDAEYAEHKTRCLPVPMGENVRYSLARTDPVYFVVNQLGIRPYTWQAEFLDNLKDGKNTLACTSRQIGKTSTFAWFALWACCYNAIPMGTTKKTRIVFVSKTEGQAMKVISDVREYMRLGDDRVYSLTKGKVEKFFTNKIAKTENTTNSKSVITFENGCQIISLPPTDAARGYTGSQLFMDEVAFIPDDIIRDVLLPIVSATGNRVSATSTPNGKQGWFYRMFDPDDQLPDHPFRRLWCPYDVIRHDAPERTEQKDKDKQLAIRMGEERGFAQEYEADFTASESGFFGPDEVEGGLDRDLAMLHEYRGECDMGIDFGKKVSRTVVSITTLEKRGSQQGVRLLYQYEYAEEQGIGEDLVADVEQLLRQFNVQRIVVEDCPQSAFFQHACQVRGWPMTIFNPSAEKNKQYNLLRAWLRQGRIRYPNLPELLKQMHGLVVVQLPTKERIEHGAGLRDDCIDSLVIATYHQLVPETRLRVLL